MKSDFRKYLVLALSVLPVNVLLAQCEVDAGQNLTICQGESVEIGGDPTVVDAGNNYTISWSNGAGDEENPTVTPNSTTTYTVTLTDGNCVDTDEVTVTVLPSPDAGFTFGPNAACAGAPVTFTNATLGCVACEYSWDFDNPESGAANTSTANNPQHVFVAVGDGTVVFNVSLTATSSNGCSNTQVVQVSVQESPEAVLTEDANFIQCLGIGSFEVYVYDDSDPAQNAEYEIVWGDGSPDWSSDEAPDMLTHTYVGLDIFELTYTVTGANGCQDVATYDVTNISNPAIGAANPGNTLQCGPVEFCFPLSNYENNHPSTVYIVDYGDGSPLVTFAHPPPVEVCHTYSESSCGEDPAFFTFSIEAENNCPTSSVATISPIQIHTPPQAGFQPSPEPACVNSAVTFINTTIPGFNLNCNANTSETWDFGDGTPPFTVTNGGNQVHTYTAPGTYTVTLTTTNAGNQALACGSTTFSMDICIETPPTPQFSVSEDFGCMPLATAISNTSDNGISCDLLRTWEIDYFPSSCDPSNGSYSFINGTSAASDEPEIQFNSVGVYNIVLEMENSCGLFTQTIPVEVITLPEVTINPVPDICEGESVSPSAVIYDCGGTITAYNWQMAGASPSSSVNFSPGSITYANDGNFTITLGVTNECGTGNDSESLIVESAPVLNFNAQPSQEICAGSTVTITVNGAVSYVWSPAPGLLSAIGGTATVQPSVSTTYTVTGYSAAGCPTVLAIPITVNPLPQVSAANNFEICSGENVVIGATISGGTMPVVTYAWSPAAGLNNTAIANPTASPANTTNYTLTVTDSEGCVGSGIIPVTVNPLPLVNAGPDIQLCNQPVAELLSGYSPQIGGTGVWSGTGITDPVAGEFTPPGLGTYVLTYTFTDLNGCVESDDLEVEVIDPSEALAGNDTTVCSGSPAIQLAQGGTWSGVGVTPGGLFNPNSPGLYTLTYSIGGGSCLTSDELEITVLELPQLTMDPPVELCAGDSVQLGVSVSGGNLPIVSFSWSPGPGLSESDIADPWAAPAISTQYLLTVTDSEGCSSQASQMVTVNPNPSVNAGNNLVLCDQPVPEVLMGYSPAGGEWSGPNVSNNGVFTPDGTGLFTLYYSYTDPSGCTAVDSITVEVADPTPANAGPDFDICLNASPVQLAQPGTWTGINVSPGGLFTPSQAGTFTLLLTTGVGTCQTSDETEVVIHELPVADAGPHETICIGENVQLNASVVSPNLPVTMYSWSGGAGLSSYNIANPIASPLVTTTYNLTVVDSEGCSDNDQVTVFVNPLPVITAGLDIVLCDQPVPEVLTGYSPAGGEWSGPNVSNNGVFTPDGTGLFTLYYSYTDPSGCIAVDSITVEVADPTPANAGPDFDVCLNASPVQLAQPGTWTGINVSPGGLFTPSQAGTFSLLLTTGVGTCQTSDETEVVVHELPVADAGPHETICIGEDVQLNASAVSPNLPVTLYSWSGGAGLSSYNIANPIASPLVTTTYNLTVVDSEGCSDNDQVTVFVNPLPIITAGSDIVLCDQPIEEVLGGFTPEGPGDTGVWSGAGITDPDGVFLSPGTGTYVLTYTFTDENGCVSADQIEVEVVSPQVADAGDDIALCPNEGPYALSGFSPGSGGTWSGIGITDAGAGTFDPEISGSGVFELLYEYGSGTCYTFDMVEVTVYDLPILNAGNDEEVCGNEPVFELSGFDPPLGTWEGTGILNGADGSFDPGIGAGTYQLIYWYMDPLTGCADTVEKAVTVHPVPVASFTVPLQDCTNAASGLVNTSAGANTYEWDMGNGVELNVASPQYTYPDPGQYTIGLAALNNFGCSDTTSGTTEINDPPLAELELSTYEGCAPLEVTFVNNSYGEYLSFDWDLDISSSQLEVPDALVYPQGDDIVVYDISLEAVNYCGTSLALSTVTVYPQPVAGFGTNLDVFCSPFTVEFNNISVGNPDEYDWDFGDGTGSTWEEPGTHIYFTDSLPSDYTITLIATNECGIDTFDYTITVLPNTVTSFFNTDITGGCAPLQVEFTDFSEGGTIITYDFGNNDITDEPNPVHVFDEPGPYTVYQYVNNGCSFDTSFIFINVLPGPDLDFEIGAEDVCENVAVQFQNLSQNVSDVSWDFGDGSTSEEANPLHAYAQGGTYTVTLFGTSSLNECPGQVQQSFTVFNAPAAQFESGEEFGCSPLSVNFDNNTFGANFYVWDFGDGNTSADANPQHTFVNQSGQPIIFEVVLIAQNLQLCADTFAVDVLVNPMPSALFTLDQSESCENPVTVDIENLSTGAIDYEWDLSSGGESDLVEPVLELSGVGTHVISLLVSNSYGCEDSHQETFTIHPIPEASFSVNPESGCMPLLAAFTNTSSLEFDSFWTFGDGAVSGATSPGHIYLNPGLYHVSLTVTSQFGCVDDTLVTDAIEVFSLPVANFSFSPEVTNIYNPEFQFTDLSEDPVLWFWSFGDGGVSFEQHPLHVYGASGAYLVELLVLNDNGCESRHTETVVIDEDFSFYVPNAFTPDGDGLNDVFLPVLVGGPVEFYEFKIFDRWGEKIFETNQQDEPWVGNYKGGDYYVKDDVYVWQAKIRLSGGQESKYFYGHVTMLR